jgi:hypothetical protein
MHCASEHRSGELLWSLPSRLRCDDALDDTLRKLPLKDERVTALENLSVSLLLLPVALKLLPSTLLIFQRASTPQRRGDDEAMSEFSLEKLPRLKDECSPQLLSGVRPRPLDSYWEGPAAAGVYIGPGMPALSVDDTLPRLLLCALVLCEAGCVVRVSE